MSEKSDIILAQAIAGANDDQQAGLLNSLARELFVTCRGSHGFQNQLCAMSEHLDQDGRRMIKILAEFVELREKELPT